MSPQTFLIRIWDLPFPSEWPEQNDCDKITVSSSSVYSVRMAAGMIVRMSRTLSNKFIMFRWLSFIIVKNWLQYYLQHESVHRKVFELWPACLLPALIVSRPHSLAWEAQMCFRKTTINQNTGSNSFCVSVCAAGLLGWYWAGQVLSGPARRVTSPASDSGHTDTGDTGRKWAACKVRNAGYKSIKGWGAGLFYHLSVPPLTCSTTTNGIRGLGTWI